MFPLKVDLAYTLGSLAAGAVKNLPVTHEIRDHWEGPLEKGMAAHSSVLAWRIPWTEDLGQGMGGMWLKALDKTEQLTLSLPYIFLNLCHISLFTISGNHFKHSSPSRCLLLMLNRTSHTLDRLVVF